MIIGVVHADEVEKIRCKPNCVFSSKDVCIMIMHDYVRLHGHNQWCEKTIEEWMIQFFYQNQDVRSHMIVEVIVMQFNLMVGRDEGFTDISEDNIIICTPSALIHEALEKAKGCALSCETEHPCYAEMLPFVKNYNEGLLGSTPCISNTPISHTHDGLYPIFRDEYWTHEMMEDYIELGLLVKSSYETLNDWYDYSYTQNKVSILEIQNDFWDNFIYNNSERAPRIDQEK